MATVPRVDEVAERMGKSTLHGMITNGSVSWPIHENCDECITALVPQTLKEYWKSKG